MRIRIALLFTVMFVALSASLGEGVAQPAQASYTVNLNSFTLQVTYPSEVLPGDNVTINVQATPSTGNTYLQTLVVTVYYADSAGLHLVGTQTLVSNPQYAYNAYGYTPTGSFSKSFTVIVPQNATRTSLVAVFSETVQSNSYYNYPPYGYFFDCNDPIFCAWYYPSYSYNTVTDDAIAPLPYINAATPESVALQSENQMLQQQLNQTQAQNQQLQATISQDNTTIGLLRQQLAAATSMTQTYQAVAFGAIILFLASVVVASFLILQNRTRDRKKKSAQKAETSSSQ